MVSCFFFFKTRLVINLLTMFGYWLLETYTQPTGVLRSAVVLFFMFIVASFIFSSSAITVIAEPVHFWCTTGFYCRKNTLTPEENISHIQSFLFFCF